MTSQYARLRSRGNWCLVRGTCCLSISQIVANSPMALTQFCFQPCRAGVTRLVRYTFCEERGKNNTKKMRSGSWVQIFASANHLHTTLFLYLVFQLSVSCSSCQSPRISQFSAAAIFSLSGCEEAPKNSLGQQSDCVCCLTSYSPSPPQKGRQTGQKLSKGQIQPQHKPLVRQCCFTDKARLTSRIKHKIENGNEIT